VSLSARLGAYVDHPDPATRLANTVALLAGSNGPFYPLYVWCLVPEAGPAALATMAASPFFFALPWLSRRSSAAARAALPGVGIANTVWTAALLGTGTGVGAFLFPCMVLATLCWREKRVTLFLVGAGLVVQQLLLQWPWTPISELEAGSQIALVSLNSLSVGALLAFIVLRMACLLADDGAHRSPG
jgi:hypothetical protein